MTTWMFLPDSQLLCLIDNMCVSPVDHFVIFILKQNPPLIYIDSLQ